MRVDALEEALERDSPDGIRPWLVVASAGTVDTGAVDPLAEIAELCRRYGAWFHVDGAYGGLFMLCDEGRELLRGIERADSVALDPHKTLFLPYGTGAVGRPRRAAIVRRVQRQRRLYPPLGESEVGPSPADLSPELTRHFRALRLWLPLQLAGRRRLPRRAVGEDRARPLFPRPPVGDRRLGCRARRPICRSSPSATCPARRRRTSSTSGCSHHPAGRARDAQRHADRRMSSISAAPSCVFRTHLRHVDEAIEAILDGVASLNV